MNWIDCLCLSVPPSVALYFAARAVAAGFRGGLLTFVRNLNDSAVAVASRAQSAVENAAETIATAHVRAARYEGKFIRPKSRPDKPGPVTALDRWLATDGREFPESVKDQCAWAYGRLQGRETDLDQGDEEQARRTLDHFAPGLANAAVAEYAREISGS